MVRDTVAYSVVPPGSQDAEGGIPVGPPDHAVTLNGRQEWWWEPGPVDSCCFCCHLDGGIMVLSGLRTALNTILLLIRSLAHQAFQFFTSVARNVTENVLETTQEEYITGCESNPRTLSYDDCQQLEQKIDDLQNSLSWQQEHMSATIRFNDFMMVFCLVVGLAGGLAGLWAGCGRNTFAAKLFFWSWPASLALTIVYWIVLYVIIEQLKNHGSSGSHLMPSTSWLVISSIHVFFIVYFTKVSWSYYTVLEKRDRSASSNNESDIELRGIVE